MEKTITLTVNQAYFFKGLITNWIQAKNEDILIKKLEILADLKKPLKDYEIEYSEILAETTSGDRKSEIDKKFNESKVEVVMSSELVDWSKAQWKEILGLIHTRNPNGEIISTGLVQEAECQSYADIKYALEDAKLVKKEIPNE